MEIRWKQHEGTGFMRSWIGLGQGLLEERENGSQDLGFQYYSLIKGVRVLWRNG